MAIINSNTNLTAVSYAVGEVLDVQGNARLTINSSTVNNTGSIQCLTRGEVYVENASTTTAIVIKLNAIANRLDFRQNGKLTVRGLMIQIATGTGTTGQTIDFTSVAGGAIDYPSYLEVETGSGTEIYEHWAIVPMQGTFGFINFNEWGSSELGRVALYNTSTKILTFGNGTNGNVVPNGAKVRIPNIHFTCAVNNATITSRCQTNTSAAGTVDIENCSFSDAIFPIFSGFSLVRLVKVGCVGRASLSLSAGSFDIKGLQCHPDSRQNTTQGVIITTISGISSIDSVLCVSNNNTNSFQINTVSLSKIAGITSIVLARSLALISTLFGNIICPLIEDITTIGGRITIQNWSNGRLVKYRHSDTSNGSLVTANALNGLFVSVCTNCIFDDIGLTSTGSPPYNQFFLIDGACSDLTVKNVTINAQNHCVALLTYSGNKTTFYNVNFTNSRTVWLGTNAGTFLKLRKILNNQAATIQVFGGSEYDFVQARSVLTTIPLYFNSGTFHTLVNNPATTGNLFVGAFTKSPAIAVTGAENTDWYFDNNGKLFISSDAIQATFTSPYTLKSITSFQNVAPTLTGDNTSGLTYDFRICNPKDLITAQTWQSLTGANLSTSIAALTNYNSSKGFLMQVRVTAVGANSNRSINLIQLPTNNDQNYQPIVGTTRLSVSGAIPGSLVGFFDNTVPAAPVLLDTAIANAQGNAAIEVPYNFDGTTIPFFVRVRKAEYLPIKLFAAYSDLPVNLVVAQILISDITGNQIYGRGNATQKLRVGFDSTPRHVTIADGLVTGESLFDAIAEYQASESGIQFESIFSFDGKDGLVLQPWKFRRRIPSDSNAAIDIAVTVDGSPESSPDVESYNSTFYGSIDFRARTVRSVFSASDANLVAKAVWEYAMSAIDTIPTTGVGGWVKAKLFQIFANTN